MELRKLTASLALMMLVLCSAEASSSDSGYIPPWQSFVPGQYIDLQKYEEAGRKFDEAWELGEGAASTLSKVNEVTEPEALMALWSLLNDPKSRVFYTSFTPQKKNHLDETVHIRHPGDDLDRVPSFDGLIGFRVVWQKEIDTPEGPKLISAILTYYFDKKLVDQDGLPQFFVRRGPGTVRIRFEVKPFKKDGTYSYGTGILGMSWSTDFDAVKGLVLDAKTYVHEDGFLKYRYVGTCDLATHCIACHHSDRRNQFSLRYSRRSAENMDGFADFVGHLQNEFNLTDAETEKLEEKLKNPRKAFPANEVLTAIQARWKKIR